jgi:cell division protein FtsQ
MTAAVPFDVRLMNTIASVLFTLLALLLMGAAGWWALRHPLFSVGGITVEGEVTHNSAMTLRANVAPKVAGNFFTVRLDVVREAFESVPWVRQATVRRQFPNRLRVALQEHEAVALWGSERDATLLNGHGEVFEANLGDVEQATLPRLSGPKVESAQVLAMYRALAPVLEPLDLGISEMVLSGRGSWQLTLDNGANVELGRGSVPEVVERAQVFVRTLTQVTSHYGRRPEALVSADLRHVNGYAIRLRGVTTTGGADAKKK